jgi:primosomal protein N' (replication factor Y)
MMVQVSGRLGRSEKTGKVIMTYNPVTIRYSKSQNDYLGMYNEQLRRQIYKYPPYFRIIKHIKTARFQQIKGRCDVVVSGDEPKNLNMPVLGPEEPAISRIRNEYIRVIIIKNSAKVLQWQAQKKLFKKC